MSDNPSSSTAKPLFISRRGGIALAAACLLGAAPVGAALQASPDNAEQPKAPENSARQNPAPKAERRICRNIESTGSRLETQRVCLTAREWREVER